jgi:O-antigen ligase
MTGRLLLALAALLAACGVGLILIAGPFLGIVAILVVLSPIVILRFPGVLFAAYLLLAFYKGGVQPYSPVDVTIILAALNVLQFVPLARGERIHSVSLSGVILWILMSILILAGVLYAPDQDLALDRMVRWWSLVLIPILAGALRVGTDPKYLRQFLWTFFLMGAVGVVLGLTQLSSVERLTVLNTNTIQVARAVLLVPLLGIAYVFREPYRLPRVLLVVAIPAAIIVALASGSRGPLLFLGILGFVGFVRYISRPRDFHWRRAALVTGLAVASIGVVSLVAVDLPSVALDRFVLLGDFAQSAVSGELTTSVGDTSAGSRIVLFEAAADMFETRPVLGVGTSGFEALAPRYLSPDELEAWPHNAFLQTAAEFGLIGLGILIALVFLGLTRRLPPGHAGSALRILSVFFFLNAMVSGDIFSDRETWGLLMLVLLIQAPGARGLAATATPRTPHRDLARATA